MELYNYKNLEPLMGKEVKLLDKKGNAVFLTISEVNKGIMDNEQWEAFSVIYRGEPSFFVPQGTYIISHPSLGENQLFISPKSEVEYETVVNRERTASL